MKLFTLKRSAAAFMAAVIIISAAAGTAAHIASANTAPMPVVVIDAGHGGIDAGVRGKVSGVKESEINLAIAYRLRDFFEGAGFCAVLTRKSQAGLYGLPTSGFKLRDMQRRREIIEESSADMVISVHQNFYSDGARRGAQVFFSPDSQSGKKLAACIQNSLNAMEGAAEHSALAGDYYMLRCTYAPSVIVECGFLSNAEDEALLNTAEYRRQIAYAIFAGSVSYFC